jgi:hypothetical protein
VEPSFNVSLSLKIFVTTMVDCGDIWCFSGVMEAAWIECGGEKAIIMVVSRLCFLASFSPFSKYTLYEMDHK